MTSKHFELKVSEFRQFVPPKRTTQFIERYRVTSGLHPSQINILDWGCGRGRETLWFRERGYNAYGVDVDSLPVDNGAGLLEELGHPRSCLRVLDEHGRAPFPSGYFHITYSNQVFEHIANLSAVAEELHRITRDSGFGYHVFPAHKYLVEGHLKMPLVHWIPKNAMRKWCIAAWTAVGREPHWSHLEGLSVREKAEEYYMYSKGKTFYRTPAEIRGLFKEKGFDADFMTVDHPRVKSHPLLSRLIRMGWSKSIVNFLLLHFVSNELRLRK